MILSMNMRAKNTKRIIGMLLFSYQFGKYNDTIEAHFKLEQKLTIFF